MLALKLHKGNHPTTKLGSFWVPIVDWRSARIHLKNWSRTLPAVQHVTMISVPNRHPVFVAVDWSTRHILSVPAKQLPFVPLCDIKKKILTALKPLKARRPATLHHVGQGYYIHGPQEAGTPAAEYPEMILGADLPRGCIKWTKDIRLLMQGDQRERLRKKSEQELG